MFVRKFDSSVINSVGYDNRTLSIGLKGGKAYIYYNVPKRVFTEFLAAESKGTYFIQNIKDKYEYKDVTAEALSL